jgi:hypothetical protein
MSETSRKNAKYIITELKMPPEKQKMDAEYSKYAKRILWLDENVAPGAFHMNVAWYLHPTELSEPVPHTHETDEIIGFFGSDRTKPYDLGGEIELWLEDEKYMLTKSCMIFVPAGMKHCPMHIRRVDQPIFHFTTVTGGKYKKEIKPKKI